MHGKNSNVRLALGYYAAFKASGDPRYLKDFDRSLVFFDRLPRGETTSSVTGRRFILPVHVFVGFEMPKAESGVSIDPNQDASVALAYTLAFHEPASIFFLNSAVGERARENLAAALDMIREDGFLPLSDEPKWRDKCDTAYSWWTLYQAHLANGFWQDQSAARKIQAAYDYLRPAVAAGRTMRVYPMTYDGPAKNPAEFWLALPVAAAYGRSHDIEAIYGVLNRIFERPQDWWDTPGGYTWGTTERMSR
jgi:hypothetical protein